MTSSLSRAIGALIVVLALPSAPCIAQAEPGRPKGGRLLEEYVVGVDDVLQISVWSDDTLSTEVIVRPDGRITMPLVNDVDAAGKTTQELRESIEQKLQPFFRSPTVAVIVKEINSFKVYVLGEVNDQGVLQLTGPTNLLQAIARAGGLTEYSRQEVIIVRSSGESQQRIDVSLKRLLSGKPEFLGDNVALAPNDILLVN